jgi:nanoRNase/pAp phosphatase (c-di-AMP/oligoRNAs hydrolase)
MGQTDVYRLLEVAGETGAVLILPHNDPDPDAIASAVALKHLLESRLNAHVDIAYHGIIGRAENRALVRYLGHPLRRMKGADLESGATIALVDTQPGAGNNPLPAHIMAQIVIDHHPWREATAGAAFADVRSTVGATSTVLVEYLNAANVELTPQLATALFYGIKTDTFGPGRAIHPEDATVYFGLEPLVDADGLFEIEYAQLPIDYFRHLDAALNAARVYDGVVIAYLGSMTYPDLAAEIADLLLRLEKTRWVTCMGVHSDTLIMSVRCRHRAGNAGHMVQAVVATDGIAGGHGSMAAGHIPLGGRTAESLAGEITRRTLQYLQIPPETIGRPLIELHPDEAAP